MKNSSSSSLLSQTHSQSRRCHRDWWALIVTLVMVGLSSGCEHSATSAAPQASADWAYRPEKPVASVPELTPTAPQLQTAAIGRREDGPRTGWPLGSPVDMTRPLDRSNPRREAPSSTKKAKLDESGKQYGGSEILVQVLTSEATSKPSDKAPAAQDKAQRSRLEQLYKGDFNKQADRRLVQFGYALFDRPMSEFDHTGLIPPTYQLGVGDEILLTLSGTVDGFYRLEVDRDGAINIPEFGPLPVAGEQYGALAERVTDFLEQRRHGFDLKVSLGKLRTIQVQVVGRVAQPGWVRIPALGSPVAALHAAGGPAKDGSLRRIELQRAGANRTRPEPVDLYQFLRGSESVEAPLLLQDGDVVKVPPIGPTIGVAGFVQQPGIYELLNEAPTVAMALELAGGLTPFSFTPHAHLERTVDGRGRQRVDVELSPEGIQQVMGDGELLMVEAVEDDRQPVVRIEGEVARPGEYAHHEGMTLSDLVGRAEGLTVDAYQPQVLISRQVGESGVLEMIPGRESEPSARRVMVADLAAALAGDPAHDLPLMPLDLVRVRSRAESRTRAEVEILGPLQRPGTYELTAGMRVSELVAIAGNATPSAYYDEAELIRRVLDEDARQLNVQRHRFDLRAALDPAHAKDDLLNPVLANGDRLVVRALQKTEVRARIEGRVRFPGEYVFPAGATIADLVAAAGGILSDADLRAARFTRESTRRLQQERLDHLRERTRRWSENAFTRIVQTGRGNEGLAGKLALEQSEDLMNRITSSEADGRIVIPLTDRDFPDSRYNLTLENGDRLRIPRFHATVSVAGHVFSPLTLVVEESLTVESALDQAGGLTEMADADLLYVVRADGRVESVAQKPARLSRRTQLFAGDVLLVPAAPIERTLGAQVGEALILSRQLAETALISSQIGNSLNTTLVSPFQPKQNNADAALLED